MKNNKSNRIKLTMLFAFVIFSILTISVLLAAVVVFILVKLGFFTSFGVDDLSLIQIIAVMSIVSLTIGFAVAFFSSKIPLKPVNRIVESLNRLSSGDYKARLSFGKPLGLHPTFSDVSDSFNLLAEELQNTEMLRSDFINNFSHEFKTPIVSIAGFAKLLRRGNLTEEQRSEYYRIIEEESLRLSYMATNVLNLTKVENQSILTDISRFNLSEQIRASVLLLEDKWSKKNITFSMDFDEFFISANEELLKQVWINLLDNAIKFSFDGGDVEVNVKSSDKSLIIKIGNSGIGISENNLAKVFNKFYQTEESHSTPGNGVGLAIVKKIVDLHNGNVYAESNDVKTIFTVVLPNCKV